MPEAELAYARRIVDAFAADPTAPRAETHTHVGPRLGDVLFAFQLAAERASPARSFVTHSRAAGGVYARGPPAMKA